MVWLKLGVFTAGTALLAVLAFVAIDRGKWLARQVDDMLVPCLHGADYDDGCQCIGPWGGKFCSECLCVNGICSKTGVRTPFADSEWGCRCRARGPEGLDAKWFGRLCEVCHAENQTTCTGECLAGYYGPQCSQRCEADLTYEEVFTKAPESLKLIQAGGSVEACGGHGVCQDGCVCDPDWFPFGDTACAQTCEACLQGTCQNINGRAQCVCDADWFGPDCSQQCPNRCSGHGICLYDGAASCECLLGWRGEDCSIECPNSQNPCHGHGVCNDKGFCLCDEGYERGDCSCNPLTTCSGAGVCGPAACECFGNFGGDDCGECLPDWFGRRCDVFCRDVNCNNGFCDDDGGCRCKDRFQGPQCDECEPSWYPKVSVFEEYGLEHFDAQPCSFRITPQLCNYLGVANENIGMPGESLCACEGHIADASFCTECEEGWFPGLGGENPCTRQCNAATCENGKCDALGECICFPGFSGARCDRECTDECGNGVCESNKLEKLLDAQLGTEGQAGYHCSCDPQEFDSLAQRFYGMHCNFTCPSARFAQGTVCNNEICKVEPIRDAGGIIKTCYEDYECGFWDGTLKFLGWATGSTASGTPCRRTGWRPWAPSATSRPSRWSSTRPTSPAGASTEPSAPGTRPSAS